MVDGYIKHHLLFTIVCEQTRGGGLGTHHLWSAHTHNTTLRVQLMICNLKVNMDTSTKHNMLQSVGKMSDSVTVCGQNEWIICSGKVGILVQLC